MATSVILYERIVFKSRRGFKAVDLKGSGGIGYLYCKQND